MTRCLSVDAGPSGFCALSEPAGSGVFSNRGGSENAVWVRNGVEPSARCGSSPKPTVNPSLPNCGNTERGQGRVTVSCSCCSDIATVDAGTLSGAMPVSPDSALSGEAVRRRVGRAAAATKVATASGATVGGRTPLGIGVWGTG